jgi:AraC-like DNA-binding protein
MGVQELAVVGLVGSGVGAALGLPMVWPRPRGASDPRLLGAAMLLVSAVAALISARLAGFVPASDLVGHAINLGGLIAFAMAVVYTRHTTGSPNRRAWTLWLPAGVYLAVAAGRAVLGLDTSVPFIWLLPVVLSFTAMSAATLRRRTGRTATALVPPEWVVGFLAVVNVAQIIRMDFGHVPAIRALVPLVFTGGFVAMVAFVAWRTVAGRLDTPLSAAVPERPAAPRYERSALDELAARALLARLDDVLTRERLFARPELTLGQLADAAQSTPHLVSEALNRFGGTSFRDLVTGRRVDDVKAQLRDPESDRYTIEGIGAAAGFRSRSALYDAFHRREGMTPTAFRAAIRRPAGEQSGASGE